MNLLALAFPDDKPFPLAPSYWLSTFRYMRAIARTECAWDAFDQALAQAKAVTDPAKRQALARAVTLPARIHLIANASEVLYCPGTL